MYIYKDIQLLTAMAAVMQVMIALCESESNTMAAAAAGSVGAAASRGMGRRQTAQTKGEATSEARGRELTMLEDKEKNRS